MFLCKEGGWNIALLKKTFVVTVAIAVLTSSARADLYIRDDLIDTGIEPNPSSGPMWVSPDIWVRNDPLPGWNPRPYDFTLPVGSPGGPPAWVDATHFNPDYRSPLSGKPNWVYVRIRNKGAASTGTERLQLYWASASTGLIWDPLKVGGSFIDNVQGGVLFGSEITKVRKNAAAATQAERDAYIAALRKIATDPALSWASLGGVSYWLTQQEIHRFGPTYRHGFNGGSAWVPSVAFLPWHREFINRFEGLLQEADPTVKLLYWQWTNRPVPPFTGTFSAPPFLDYSANFMGSFGAGASAAVQIGAPLSPDTDPGYANSFNGLSKVTRRLQPPSPFNPLAQSDTTVVGRIDYDATSANTAFSGGLESLSHNNSHVYIASTGNNTIVGDQLFQPYAGRDPFFYLLHAKVDELWARWQRKNLNNLDPATTFSNVNVPMSTIALSMGPWDGTLAGPDGLAPSVTTLHPTGSIEPFSAAGGQSYSKTGDDRSVTSPPFYDTAPLTIPALQNNQEVILEIPWYPPNPAGFGAITDPQHVCLIARIETSTSAPFGMTVAETSDINFNTQQNNNIAWRNVSVVDTFPGPFKIVKFLMRNVRREQVTAGLRLGTKLNPTGREFFDLGTVRIDLGLDLFERWQAGGAKGRGFEVLDHDQLRVTKGEAVLEGIVLKPGETFPVRLTFELKRDYRPTKRGEHIIYDVVQTGTLRDPNAVVGGQRYEVGVDKLTPVERGRVWRWVPANDRLSQRWRGIDFDDSNWFQRKLDLGWVEPPIAGTHGAVVAPAYYFRYAFDVEDPGFFRDLLMRIKRSDGAIVYLNEKEVYRSNLPNDAPNTQTLARAPVAGVERSVYFPVKLDPSLLRQGRNVIAVEIRRAEANRGGLTFDLELNANAESTQQAPVVQLSNIADGALMTAGRTATINADALKPGGAVRSVTLIVDDKPVQTLEKPPFSFKWRVQPGPHRISVTVTDNNGLQANAYATVTGVKNVPPIVALTQPAQHMEIAEGDPLVVAAHAEDLDGTIAKVDFYVHDSYVIGSPGRLVGTVRKAPFTATLSNLKKGHAMIVAIATDNGGARTASIPMMVIVTDKGSGPNSGHPQ
jgi:Common central domain of tyrosinase/Bacterial Ig domain